MKQVKVGNPRVKLSIMDHPGRCNLFASAANQYDLIYKYKYCDEHLWVSCIITMEISLYLRDIHLLLLCFDEKLTSHGVQLAAIIMPACVQYISMVGEWTRRM